MEAISKESSRIREMFASVAPRYDLANSVLSLGIHYFWRRALLNSINTQQHHCALDLCTGTGDLLLPLKKRYQKVVGVDFCKDMLDLAAQKIGDARQEIELLEGDALALPFVDQRFDLISVAFGVRNFENLENGLKEMQRVIKPGGQVLVLEFGDPRHPLWRAVYRFYSNHLMPLIGGFLTGQRSAYSYLSHSTAHFPCAEQFCNHLQRCGFEKASFRPLSGGIAYLYSAFKPA